MTKADKEGQRKAPILRFKGFTDDWEQRELNKTNDVRDGTHDTPKYIDSGYPLITSKNLTSSGTINFDDISYISEDDFNFINKRSNVDTNDILFGMIGTIGNPVLVGNDTNFAIKNVALIKKSDSINQYFLINILNSNIFKKYIIKTNQGNTQKFISLSQIRKFTFYAPQLYEQIEIGKILQKIDSVITLYAKKSSCLDSCIAYFIRILYDDPQFFKQKNVQNSIIKSFKLDDILIKNNAKNKDLSILNVESISNKKGFISQKEQFDNYRVASKDLSNYYVIRPKDFAYNPSRINVGSIAYKNPNEIKGIVSPLYVSFKCKNDIVLDKYLWHWFKSTNFEHQRVRLSEGGVRDILSFNQLSKMKISIPSFEIQRQTINLLEILIQYKEEVDLKLNNLKLIKNTLLQSMFL